LCIIAPPTPIHIPINISIARDHHYRRCAANMWYFLLLAIQVQMATAMIAAAEDDGRPRRKQLRYRKRFHRMLGNEEQAR
jgi:hypothetical protein